MFIAISRGSFRKWQTPKENFPVHWRKILLQKVGYYQELLSEDKLVFEQRVHHFIINNKSIGVEVDVDDTDRVLVAASAIIPVFHFPD